MLPMQMRVKRARAVKRNAKASPELWSCWQRLRRLGGRCSQIRKGKEQWLEVMMY